MTQPIPIRRSRRLRVLNACCGAGGAATGYHLAGFEYSGPYFAVYGQGGGKGTVPQWQEAMGIHWTDVRREIAEAIPPAYTHHIGRALADVATVDVDRTAIDNVGGRRRRRTGCARSAPQPQDRHFGGCPGVGIDT
ncbi:hypothetical protein [Actinacidiphila oryziradicis]|uniref:hypothetical protein n=1 Tax=Actinacidiphila oryziradicis TaxID=2571141 RepID=UPI0026AF26C3